MKYCFACAAPIDARAEICPKCGVRQLGIPQSPPRPPLSPQERAAQQASGNKMAAGLCGIFLGALGIHKFILGMTTPGVIMLVVSLLTCGVGAIPMSIIGLVEGILYLSKSDDEFYTTYVIEKKEWF
jgi:TM2 domain-containing membrane protein YozV